MKLELYLGSLKEEELAYLKEMRRKRRERFKYEGIKNIV
tara:strand:+ start:12293 stop:12409 length:117 start_codon:yes stop_codon:yes gene_type:complete